MESEGEKLHILNISWMLAPKSRANRKSLRSHKFDLPIDLDKNIAFLYTYLSNFANYRAIKMSIFPRTNLIINCEKLNNNYDKTKPYGI